MTDPRRPVPAKPAATFEGVIDAKAARKHRARSAGPPGIGVGLGVMGLVGWAVAIPTLLGAALGLWLDAHAHAHAHQAPTHGWTLALLVGGLATGCINAWSWIARQDAKMREEERDD